MRRYLSALLLLVFTLSILGDVASARPLNYTANGGATTVIGGTLDVTGTLKTGSVAITSTAAELNLNDNIFSTATLAWSAGNSTDEANVTITVKDAAGATIAAVHRLEVYISETSDCRGLTADSYSGAVTTETGDVLTALTAKKHLIVNTAATGIAVLSIVASANPADQYACVVTPRSGKPVASAASGTNWEGI